MDKAYKDDLCNLINCASNDSLTEKTNMTKYVWVLQISTSYKYGLAHHAKG